MNVNSRILCRKYNSPSESLDGRFVQQGLAAIVSSINIDALSCQKKSQRISVYLMRSGGQWRSMTGAETVRINLLVL